MPISISVSNDVKAIKKQLTSIQKKQIPFALSNALNEAAFNSRKVEESAMRKYLDKPTRFTTNSARVNKSTKKTLKAEVYIPSNRWDYLKYTVDGGSSTRPGYRHSIAINKGLLNKYGSLPRNKARRLISQKNHFVAKSKGNEYVFKRTGKDRYPIEPQILFKRVTQHGKKYPIWRMSQAMIKRDFSKILDAKLKYALRTAR